MTPTTAALRSAENSLAAPSSSFDSVIPTASSPNGALNLLVNVFFGTQSGSVLRCSRASFWRSTSVRFISLRAAFWSGMSSASSTSGSVASSIDDPGPSSSCSSEGMSSSSASISDSDAITTSAASDSTLATGWSAVSSRRLANNVPISSTLDSDPGVSFDAVKPSLAVTGSSSLDISSVSCGASSITSTGGGAITATASTRTGSGGGTISGSDSGMSSGSGTTCLLDRRATTSATSSSASTGLSLLDLDGATMRTDPLSPDWCVRGSGSDSATGSGASSASFFESISSSNWPMDARVDSSSESNSARRSSRALARS